MDPHNLYTNIKRHLDYHLDAYGDRYSVPKFHYSLHLPSMLAAFKMLFACFVNERKHKDVKRFIPNTSSGFEKTVLEKMIASQFDELADSDNYPTRKAKLLSPVHVANQALQRAVQMATGLYGPVEQSDKMANAVCRCSKGDVVHLNVDGCFEVAMINYHVRVNGKCFSCVTPWARVREYVYRIGSRLSFVYSEDIEGVCVHAKVSDTLEMVVPAKC